MKFSFQLILIFFLSIISILLSFLLFGNRLSKCENVSEDCEITQNVLKNGNERCFMTTGEIAAVVGGQVDNWTAPEFETGAWQFDAGEGNWIELTVPSWGGRIDYWNGDKNMSDSIYAGSVIVDKASFHCE